MAKSQRNPEVLKAEKGNRLLADKIKRENQICGTCKGSGMTVYRDEIIQDCPTCKGSGIIPNNT